MNYMNLRISDMRQRKRLGYSLTLVSMFPLLCVHSVLTDCSLCVWCADATDWLIGNTCYYEEAKGETEGETVEDVLVYCSKGRGFVF